MAGKRKARGGEDNAAEDEAKENGAAEEAGKGAVSAMSLLQKRQEREGEGEEGVLIDEHMQFDLGRLAAFSHASIAKLSTSDGKAMTSRAEETTQYLVNRLFQLPSEPAEWGRLAHLPNPTTALPREKPLPKPAPLTRWEKYAKDKGIQKKKKDKMVWDERSKEWKPRYGYKRAENASDSMAPILEADKDDDGAVDPWTRKDNEKKERLDKQKKREKRNTEELYGKPMVAGQNEFESRAEAKGVIKSALGTAQKSTGSLGKFDKKLKGEKKGKIKRKVDAPVVAKKAGGEKERNLELLSKIVSVDGATLDVGKAANRSLNDVVAFQKSSGGDDRPSKRAKGKAGRKPTRK